MKVPTKVKAMPPQIGGPVVSVPALMKFDKAASSIQEQIALLKKGAKFPRHQ